jgi:hypothetical protein
VPVEFVLTVAPDERSAYRVEMRQDINLVDIPDYRPRDVVVVRYRPDEPWDVEIVTEPTEAWARRAAAESVDSAPESALLAGPKDEGPFCLLGTLGLLLGAALVVLPFRADLFAAVDESPTTSSSSSTTTTTTDGFSWPTTSTTTTTTSTVRGTASSEAMLSDGEMRRAAESLVKGMRTSSAAELTIEEHVMAVRGILGTAAAPGAAIDLNAVPYERLPGLVGVARTKLGITKPTSWRITFDAAPQTGALTIHVFVTDAEGAKASLEADAQARITARHPR